jgi:hypothetical protein
MSKPTFSTTLNPDTVRSIFLDPDGDAEFLPRGIRASIIVIRSIRAGRSHHETTQWLVNPLTSRRRFDTEMVSPICASTDCCRVTAVRLGCSISSTRRWRPRRFGPGPATEGGCPSSPRRFGPHAPAEPAHARVWPSCSCYPTG